MKSSAASFEQTLEQYWGYKSFRPLQREIIEAVFDGHDVLGLMPTGGGKSITFQVPALMKEGVCVVVTPLIALMKDQVMNLNGRGIRAAYVCSGMRQDEIVLTLDNVVNGPFKFLYVSPERLGTKLFRAKFRAMNVSMLVVDEAHCISQWGYDFRPSYLKIAEMREFFPKAPVLALTATATPEVAEDIQRNLQFRQLRVFRKSFVRDNLHYLVRRVENKEAEIRHILEKTSGSAIVYTRSRKKTEEFAKTLQAWGFGATAYHAGLRTVEKNERQTAWLKGEVRVMVATNAFGMGIDKPDVRVVVHLDIPNSLEEYYQEAGRAGRDEERAYCVLLVGKEDSTTLRRRVSDSFPEREFIKQVYDYLGSYLQVGIDSGFEATFDFELWDFCRRYRLPSVPTDNALQLLEMAGYLRYTTESERFSRLMIPLQKEELYRLRGISTEADELIQDVLRNYTGLFADYIYVVEEEIARRLSTTVHQVYETLKMLSKRRVMSYIPRKNIPQITYTQRREPMHYLFISRDILEKRCGRFEERMAKMLFYVGQEEGCRVDTFLNYFGEKSTEPCGKCDLCLEHKRLQGDEQRKRKELAETIREIWKPAMSVDDLLKAVPGNRMLILELFREMNDNGQLTGDS